LSFGFWYFGHFSCVIFFPLFFRLAHLALQNVNKEVLVFSIRIWYLAYPMNRSFVTKSDQKPKTKNKKWDEFCNRLFKKHWLAVLD
jgi:hypothetical protein